MTFTNTTLRGKARHRENSMLFNLMECLAFIEIKNRLEVPRTIGKTYSLTDSFSLGCCVLGIVMMITDGCN